MWLGLFTTIYAAALVAADEPESGATDTADIADTGVDTGFLCPSPIAVHCPKDDFCCYYAECEDGACPIKIDPKVIDGNYIFGQKQFKRNGVQEEHINVPVERRWQA